MRKVLSPSVLLLLAKFVVVFGTVGLLQAQDPKQPDRLGDAKRNYVRANALLQEASPESLESARQLFLSAAKDFEESNDISAAGDSWLGAGVASERLGNSESALAEFNRSLAAFTGAKDHLGESVVSNNLALLYVRQGNIDEAKTYYNRSILAARSAKDRRVEAQALENLGTMFANLKIPDKAIEHLQKASLIFEAISDQAKLMDIFNSIGLLYNEDLNEAPRAREYFLRARDAAQSIGNRLGEGVALYNTGTTFASQKQLPEAIKFYNESVERFRKVGAPSNESIALYDLGLSLTLVGSHKDAATAFERGLVINTELSNKVGITLMQMNLGLTYYQLQETVKASEMFEAALPNLDLVAENPIAVTSLHTMAQLSLVSGNAKRSIDLLNKALQICRSKNDAVSEANTLRRLGFVFGEIGDHKAAFTFYDQAERISRSAGEIEMGVEIQTQVALSHMSLGQYQKAKEVFETTLAHHRKTKNSLAIAGTIGFLARVHLVLGDYERSLALNKEALELFKGQPDPSGRSLIHGNFGYLYSLLGDYPKAIENFEAQIAVASKANILTHLATGNNGLGLVHAYLEEHEKAIDYYSKSLDYFRRYGAKNMEAVTLSNLAYSKKELKRFKESIADLESALLLYRSIEDTSAVGFVYLNLGDALLEEGHLERSHRALVDALALAKSNGNSRLEAYVLASLGEYWLKNKNKSLAVLYGKQAVNIIQTTRASITGLDVELQQSYIRQFEKGYHRLAEVLVDLGRIAEAEQVLAMLKEDEYFEFVRRDDGLTNELLARALLSPDEKKALDEYKKYALELTLLGKELGELQVESRQFEIGKFPKKARLEELEKQIANANLVFTTFLDGLKLKFGERDVRVSTVESGSQALLKELNEPRTVFISTILGKERLNIIVTSADVQKAYTVPIKEEEINRLVAEFRSVLRSPRFDPRSRGKALFDVLFPDGVMKDLTDIEADTIVWSLDGTLRYVPISALWDGKQYLVERFNNVVVTLASRDKLNVPSSGREKWRALGVGVSKEMSITESDGTVRNFEALLAVPEELCSVIQDPDQKSSCEKISVDSLGVIGGRTLLDESFTFQNFRDSLGRFPVVHVASHFQLTAGNENDSYLLLGGGADRKLSLAAIRQGGARFAGVDLLTLSACNTAMSAERMSNGLEVEGFGALAQRSGAKSVLASLWAVADSSTRDLMIEFYRQMKPEKTVGKAEALRVAQLSLLFGKVEKGETPAWRSAEIGKDGATTSVRFTRDLKAPFAHPYYWSPFILIGNWQ